MRIRRLDEQEAYIWWIGFSEAKSLESSGVHSLETSEVSLNWSILVSKQRAWIFQALYEGISINSLRTQSLS